MIHRILIAYLVTHLFKLYVINLSDEKWPSTLLRFLYAIAIYIYVVTYHGAESTLQPSLLLSKPNNLNLTFLLSASSNQISLSISDRTRFILYSIRFTVHQLQFYIT